MGGGNLVFFSILFAVLAVPAALLAAPLSVAPAEEGSWAAAKAFTGDKVDLEMKDGFGAEFWLVDKENTMPTWLPDDLRNTSPVFVTKRGRELRLVVFLFNPGRAEFSASTVKTLYSDVTYDVMVHRPDMVKYVGAMGVAAWSGPSPSPYFIERARLVVKLSFKPSEPLGDYTIMVAVHDNVRKLTIPLLHTIKVRD